MIYLEGGEHRAFPISEVEPSSIEYPNCTYIVHLEKLIDLTMLGAHLIDNNIASPPFPTLDMLLINSMV